MRSGTKSDLVDCLLEAPMTEEIPAFDAIILDGAAIVNMVRPQGGQTFYEYAIYTFIPYVTSFNVSRVDVVWDVYLPDSIKTHTRNKRGKGKRRKVACDVRTPKNWQGLPIFHALTGCDTVSSMNGIGKRSAWAAWKAYPQMDAVFAELSHNPNSMLDHFSDIERFIVIAYDRTSGHFEVNEARKHLFTKKGRDIQSIPPTQAALHQHMKRALFQGGHCWSHALSAAPNLPSPSDWGWVREGDHWKPVWTTKEDASKALNKLIKCGCKKGCKEKRCKCKKAGLTCTALCLCDGCSHLS